MQMSSILLIRIASYSHVNANKLHSSNNKLVKLHKNFEISLNNISH
jgi:hypothetical protein